MLLNKCLVFRPVPLPRSYFTTRKVHNGPTTPISEIKLFLKEYSGGSVDLIKNSNGIAHMILNHPERRNALSGSMMVDMLDIVEELEKWDKGFGLIVRGKENQSKVFCSGGDLKTVDKIGDPEGGFKMSTFMHHVTDRIRSLPLLSVTMLDGLAVGGGAELTTMTDYRIVTPGSRVAFVQAKMGVAPGWGGGRRLVQLVGQKKALDLFISCRKLNVQEGLECGFFDDEIALDEDDDILHPMAEGWLLDKVKGVDPSVVRALKAIVNNNSDSEMECRLFAPLWGGPANKEALSKQLKHK